MAGTNQSSCGIRPLTTLPIFVRWPGRSCLWEDADREHEASTEECQGACFPGADAEFAAVAGWTDHDLRLRKNGRQARDSPCTGNDVHT